MPRFLESRAASILVTFVFVGVRIAAAVALLVLSACGRSDRIRTEPPRVGLRITPRVLPVAVLGQPYQVRLVAARSRGRVGWRLLGPRPSWMETSMEGDGNKEFVLSGLPDSAGRFEISVEAIDSEFQSDRMMSPLIVQTDGSPPEITNQRLPVGFVGVSYRVALSARGGRAPYVFAARDLPSPLRMSEGEVQYIEGIPRSATMRTVVVSVTDADGMSTERSFEFEIRDPEQDFEIINLSFPAGDLGQPYAASAEVNRGEAIWTVASPLPDGLVVSESEGRQLRIQGMPEEVGRFVIDLEARIGDGSFAQAQATIVIRNSMVDPLVLLPTGLPSAMLGVPYREELRAEGGVDPLDWRITVGTLPAGIRSVGMGRSFIIEGTPTVLGSHPFRVIVTGAQGGFAEILYNLTVDDIPFGFATTSLPNAELNRPYQTTIEVSGGVPPYVYSIATGSLPSGLQLEPSNTSEVVISGVPDSLGPNGFSVRVQDAQASTLTNSYVIEVLPQAPPLQVSVPPISAEACGPVSADITATGGLATPIIWSLNNSQHGLQILSRGDSAAVVYGHYRPEAGPVTVIADRGSQIVSAPLNISVTATTTQPRYSAVLAGVGMQRSLHLVDICGSGSPEISSVSNALGAGNSVKFSPDGRWLAYLAGPTDQLSLWVTNLDGTSPGTAQEVGQTSGPGRSVRSFVWSPDSRFIAYEGDVLANNRYEGFAVRVASTPTSSRLHGPVVGRGVSPAGLSWSPNSRSVLIRGDFETPNVEELFVVSPDSAGADFAQLVNITIPGGAVLAAPKWNPDGGSIMYAAEAEAAGRRDLYLLPMNGALPGLPVHVTALMIPGGDVSVPNYEWSATGLRGHLVADYRVDGQTELFHWQGLNPQLLLSPTPSLAPGEQVHRAMWSPEGTALAVLVSDVNVTGSKLHLLYNGSSGFALGTPMFDDPSTGVDRAKIFWSPDGEWLGVIARNGSTNEARLVRRSGEVLKLSSVFVPARDTRSVFFGGRSANTKVFVVGANSASNDYELHVIDAQNFRNGRPTRIGSSPQATGSVLAESPEQFAVRPDGTGLVFLRETTGVTKAHLIDVVPSLRTEPVSLDTGSLRNRRVSAVFMQPRN